jgi:hypothetical protein
VELIATYSHRDTCYGTYVERSLLRVGVVASEMMKYIAGTSPRDLYSSPCGLGFILPCPLGGGPVYLILSVLCHFFFSFSFALRSALKTVELTIQYEGRSGSARATHNGEGGQGSEETGGGEPSSGYIYEFALTEQSCVHPGLVIISAREPCYSRCLRRFILTRSAAHIRTLKWRGYPFFCVGKEYLHSTYVRNVR